MKIIKEHELASLFWVIITIIVFTWGANRLSTAGWLAWVFFTGFLLTDIIEMLIDKYKKE